jgi:hypothetical protein
MFRKLRVAFSVLSGIVCLLLIVLWVRSYWWYDDLYGPMSANRLVAVGSMTGALSFGTSAWPSLPPPYLDYVPWRVNSFAMEEEGSTWFMSSAYDQELWGFRNGAALVRSPVVRHRNRQSVDSLVKAIQPSHTTYCHDARRCTPGGDRLLRKIILTVKAISPKERFAQYFGTELSDEEERVVDIVWSIDGSPRVEDIVSKAGPEIEPVIVSRTIAQLIAARLLTRVEMNNQRILVKAWPRYPLRSVNHDFRYRKAVTHRSPRVGPELFEGPTLGNWSRPNCITLNALHNAPPRVIV